MPFKSKAQMKKFFAMENKGELPKGTARRWAHETKNIANLPKKKRKKKASVLPFSTMCQLYYLLKNI